MYIDRRHFIKWTGAAIAGLAGLSFTPFINSQALWGANRESSFEPDVDIYLEAVSRQVPILSGPDTDVWSYRGKVLVGPTDTLDLSDTSYLGPTFRLKKGQKVRIRFLNLLPYDTIIHWHGLHVPDLMDGHPRLVVGLGSSYTYEFEVLNRAGTYWYHPHPHGRTGHQLYSGLAGVLIVSDKEETSLPLPTGDHDLSLVIQDRLFDQNNQLVYMPGGMMDRMNGMLGDRILVNGRANASTDVDAGAYRLRIINASNARVYRLAWDDGRPLIVIGTDGGLIERPEHKEDVLLSPGERLEIWADFSRYPVDAGVRLISRPLPEAASGGMRGGMRGGRGMMGRGMMGGMMGRQSRLENETFTIMRFKVGSVTGPKLDLPDKLTPLERITRADADNSSVRRFTLSMAHMQGLINGRVFAMQEVAPDEIVHLGATEIWEFANEVSGMGMMNMPMVHPMHIHAVQFKVLNRWGVGHNGYMDKGWKDTVLLLPGEGVQVIARFAPYTGLYLYHCHNLEHGDGGMMRNFRIVL
ncbi:MAG: hypothetical protein VR64_04215 [Desulfatitalea sp. BRH_c12]|nr:MAG: hypothetical protein VR64_04215 [Desulfatitalea sp. BRH_c12]